MDAREGTVGEHTAADGHGGLGSGMGHIPLVRGIVVGRLR
jgi:hypothetical protein